MFIGDLWCSDIIFHLFWYLAVWKRTMNFITVDFIFIFKMAFYFEKCPTLHIFLFFIVFSGIWKSFSGEWYGNRNSGKGTEFFQLLLLLLYSDRDAYSISRSSWTYPLKVLVVCIKWLRNYLIWESCKDRHIRSI